MQPAELHDRVRDGFNSGDLDGLVGLYEPDAVLMAEDGPPAVGLDAIRDAFAAALSFGGTMTLETRYAVECGDVAMLSNQYTFAVPGYEVTWISSEVARRQPDGSWRYVIDNPYAAGDSLASVRAGQPEDVLGDVGEDQLLADRGDALQAGLAEVALDVVLGGVAEPAVGLHGPVGGEEAGLGGEVLGDVGLLAARLARRRSASAASRIISSAARSLAWASASGKAMPWFLPIGRSNTTRSLA